MRDDSGPPAPQSQNGKKDNAERGDNQRRGRDIEPVRKVKPKNAGQESQGPADEQYLDRFPGEDPSDERRDDQEGKDLKDPGHLHGANEDKSKTQKKQKFP